MDQLEGKEDGPTTGHTAERVCFALPCASAVPRMVSTKIEIPRYSANWNAVFIFSAKVWSARETGPGTLRTEPDHSQSDLTAPAPVWFSSPDISLLLLVVRLLRSPAVWNALGPRSNSPRLLIYINMLRIIGRRGRGFRMIHGWRKLNRGRPEEDGKPS